MSSSWAAVIVATIALVFSIPAGVGKAIELNEKFHWWRFVRKWVLPPLFFYLVELAVLLVPYIFLQNSVLALVVFGWLDFTIVAFEACFRKQITNSLSIAVYLVQFSGMTLLFCHAIVTRAIRVHLQG